MDNYAFGPARKHECSLKVRQPQQHEKVIGNHKITQFSERLTYYLSQ
jgi:hypothetical protein